MFSGRIDADGPRYCPAIEDEIDRFSEKDHHQLFIEPEGRDTHEVYVNGFSSSLPEEVQFEALRTVPGVRASDISVLMVLLKNEGVEPLPTDRDLEAVAGDGFGVSRETAVSVGG
jgi:tRNA uridine 5-carboxymethylaminomethyl modification enzyme